MILNKSIIIETKIKPLIFIIRGFLLHNKKQKDIHHRGHRALRYTEKSKINILLTLAVKFQGLLNLLNVQLFQSTGF